MAVKGPKIKPIKLCHLADIHLGYRRFNRITHTGLNQREVDVSIAFREAIDRIIKIKPDAVIIAGDLFHTVRPSNLVIASCFKEVRRLVSATKSPVIIVAGNHESPKRVDTGSVLQILSEIEGVFVSDSSPDVFKFGDLSLNVQCLPHLSLMRLKEFSLRADDKFAYNVLVTHGQIGDRWFSDFGGVDIEIKKLNPHEWDYIALGHIHIYQEVGLNAVYPGSIEHTASNLWIEARTNKGFIEVELPSGKRRFHELTSPREIVVLTPVDGAGLMPEEVDALINSRLEEVAGGVEGKIVKLELINISREVFRLLNHKALRIWRTRALNLSLDLVPASVSGEKGKTSGTRKGTLREELEEYCAGSTDSTTSSTELKRILGTYWQKTEDDGQLSVGPRLLESAD